MIRQHPIWDPNRLGMVIACTRRRPHRGDHDVCNVLVLWCDNVAQLEEVNIDVHDFSEYWVVTPRVNGSQSRW